MSRWSYETIERALEEYGGAADPADAKERKRLKLLRVATELFVSQGYRKTSVDDVARHAGVSKGTVYLYFANKGELLLHAVIQAKRRYLEQLRPVFDEQASAAERLRRWLRAALVVSLEVPLLARLMSGDMELLAVLEDLPAATVASSRAFGIELLAELIDEAAAPHRLTRAELEERAQVLTGLGYLSGLIGEQKVRGEISVERFAAVLADLIVDGIRARGGDR